MILKKLKKLIIYFDIYGNNNFDIVEKYIDTTINYEKKI